MEVESAKFRYRFMGNSPVTGDFHAPNDVEELPVVLGDALVLEQVLERVPDSVPVGDAPRPEPTPMIGINISEEEFNAKNAAENADEQVTMTSPENLRPRSKK